MERFFYPKRIGIIGVSDLPNNLGKFIIQNLIEFGFVGSYYSVGHKSVTVDGASIFRSILDIPDELDLAVIMVKAEDVPLIAKECGQKGIKRLVVPSAGFSEHSPHKKTLELQLLDICQKYNIRLMGPNCLGVVNMDNGLFLPFSPQVRMNYRKGPVGIISQSGTLAIRAALHLSYGKVGVSKVASVGNKLNVDEVDMLEYYLRDPETKIIFLYLEGLSRARKLFELACAATKPIIIFKSNISSLSHGIAKSHTTALASDEKVVDSAFRQAGIIRARSFVEMLNCAKVLLLPPLRGNRLVCISEGGGPSVIAADEVYQNGFTLSSLPQDFLDWLHRKGRAKVITLTNPLDLGDIHNWDVSIQLLEKLKELPEIDGIFYNLLYSASWEEKGLGNYQGMFDYLSKTNHRSKIPVFVRISIDAPNGSVDLNKRVPQPFFESTPDTFKAMRQVMDAQQARTTH